MFNTGADIVRPGCKPGLAYSSFRDKLHSFFTCRKFSLGTYATSQKKKSRYIHSNQTRVESSVHVIHIHIWLNIYVCVIQFYIKLHVYVKHLFIMMWPRSLVTLRNASILPVTVTEHIIIIKCGNGG